MEEVSRSKSRHTTEKDSDNRKSASVADESLHHSTGHRHRHRRRRRRSSENSDGHVHRTSPIKGGSTTSHRRHSISAGSSHRKRKSSADKGPVVEPVKSATAQKVRSRKRSSSSSDKEHSDILIIEEVSNDSGMEHTPRQRRRRSSSLKERTSRPSVSRTSTSAKKPIKVSPLPTVKEEKKKPQSTKPLQRSNSVFGGLFGPPRPAVPEEKVSCLTCMDDVVISKAPKFTCGHRMCNSCLKRVFNLSVTDPAHMPPKCCTEDCIPLKHVNKLFDDRFKMKWNRKYQEYTTKNRIYCPAKGCGSWIPPKDISRDKEGRKFGTCKRCKTQVCAKCNGKRHKAKECPKDDETQAFAEMAKNNGWQRCYNCSATVELKEGCNHMTCRCTAEFCMICGAKWKTCNCPWFNYANANADRLNHFNIPQVREEIARGGAAFAQPRAYQEELERRRQQEQADEALARRLERMDFGFAGRQAGGGWGDWFQPRVPNVNTGPADRWANPNHPPRVGGAFGAGLPANVYPLPNLVPQGQNNAAPINIVPPPRPPTGNPPPIFPQAQSRRTSVRENMTEVRRSESTRTPRPAAETRDRVLKSDRPPAENRRSAILAGLNRMSDSSRVDAWRRHVSGEPVLSPL